jgi:hypothetical protein
MVPVDPARPPLARLGNAESAAIMIANSSTILGAIGEMVQRAVDRVFWFKFLMCLLVFDVFMFSSKRESRHPRQPDVWWRTCLEKITKHMPN